MTWKSHCVVNASVTLALTGRIEIALAAMTTASLPDQIERYLPLGRHRGASHWVTFWLALMVFGPPYLRPVMTRWACVFAGLHGTSRHEADLAVGALLLGLALGPALHVLFDGCSSAGVPVAPFSRQRLRLGLYKTRHRRACWNVSELIFLAVVLAACTYSWRIRHLF